MAILTIETPLSDADRAMLKHLLRQDEPSEATEPEPDKPAPAKKTAAKKATATAKTEPEPEIRDEVGAEVEPANVPDEPVEEEIDAAEFQKLIKETVKTASGVMKTEGGSDKVKASLDKIGVERVGRLQNPEQVERFLRLIELPLAEIPKSSL